MTALWKRLRIWLVRLLMLPLLPVFGAVGGGDGDGKPDGSGGDPGGQGAGEGKSPAGAQGAGGFTQEQVDEIVRKRLERERGRFSDYEDLKRAAEELKTLKAAQLSEQERATARARELEEKLSGETSARARERLAFQQRLIAAEVRLLAAELGFADPDDAWRLADLAEIKCDEEFQVDRAGVRRALEAVAKAKPYLLKTGDGRSAGTPGRESGKKPASDRKPAVESRPPVIRY